MPISVNIEQDSSELKPLNHVGPRLHRKSQWQAVRGVEIRKTCLRIGFSLEGKWTRETLPLKPTPGNIVFAARLVRDIRARIEDGTFSYGDYFPDSPCAEAPSPRLSFREVAGRWLQSKGRLAAATQHQYGLCIRFWNKQLGDRPIEAITHSELAALVGGHAWPGPKSINNSLIVLRGVFQLGLRDRIIEYDPTEGIENSKLQRKAPDPFTLAEVDAILDDLRRNYDGQVANYFEFAFFTGCRPEETIALRWDDVDFAGRTAAVVRAKTFRGTMKDVKTHEARQLELNTRALTSLERQRNWTALKDHGFVFENPVTHASWHDERSQRDRFWKPALKRLKLRMRRAYETRHTFATLAIMAGANPAWVSRQMGHRTPKMVFEVYSKWIDHADSSRELTKLEAFISPPFPQGPLRETRADQQSSV
jgi:integrase